jgi:hypothetical protein
VADPYVEFFQSQLQPWIHYVPVARDFSDLNARLEWLGDHQAEAQKIGEAGRDWAQRHLQPDSLVRMAQFAAIISCIHLFSLPHSWILQYRQSRKWHHCRSVPLWLRRRNYRA